MDGEIKVFTNNKNAQSILYKDHVYRLFRKHKKTGGIVWRCNEKTCSVTVTTNSEINLLIKQNKPKHGHEKQEVNSELKEIRSAVKRQAQSNLYVKPMKIIKKELCGSQVNIDINALRQTMYRERRKRLPPISTSLLDVINQLKEADIKLNSILDNCQIDK